MESDRRVSPWSARKIKRESGASPPRLHPELPAPENSEVEKGKAKPLRAPDLRRHQHTVSAVSHKEKLSTSFESSETPRSCVSKSPSPVGLVEENQRLRREILSLRQMISDLKKQISTGSVTGLTLANYEQELSFKNERIQELKSQFESVLRGKIQRLETQLAESQTTLAQARTQIEQLTKRDSKPNAHIYEAISLLQTENKLLKDKLAQQVETQAAEIHYQQLEQQVMLLEQSQEKLLVENRELRSLAESSSSSFINLRNKVTSLALTLTVVSQEYYQLTEVLQLTQKDVPLSGHVLMQRLGQTFPAPTSEVPMETLLEQAVNKLSETLRHLRRLLSEAYLDECTQNCVQQ